MPILPLIPQSVADRPEFVTLGGLGSNPWPSLKFVSATQMTTCPTESRWPFHIALLLAVVTFPLIWIGGLVTTYDAGMAVPDWPGTYGYNLFLYPPRTWIAGPWDLFIEHGHRLLGALSGMLTIGLVLAVFRWDQRVWLRYFSLGALAAVVLQGCLGGARVLLDDRQLALLHGCAGPAFFGVCVALCAVTSRTWKQASFTPAAAGRGSHLPETGLSASAAKLPGLTAATTATAYLQLVIGALMRHIPVTASPVFFRWTVFAHLFFAGVLSTLIVAAAWLVYRHRNRLPALYVPAGLLVVLLLCQLVLGCAVWVVNYYWPGWVPEWSLTASYPVIESKGWLQTMIVTGHMAMGSLIIGNCVLLMLRAYRVIRREPAVRTSVARAVGGVAA